jgi:methylisocitrate lyase
MGYGMVIWPVSSLRIANKAQEKLYATLDISIVASLVPDQNLNNSI